MTDVELRIKAMEFALNFLSVNPDYELTKGANNIYKFLKSGEILNEKNKVVGEDKPK